MALQDPPTYEAASPNGSVTGPSEEPLDFGCLAPRRVPIRNLLGSHYVLCEVSEGDYRRYLELILRNVKAGPDGKPVSNAEAVGAPVQLLSWCLYKADGAGGVPVLADGSPDPKARTPVTTISGWPNRVIEPLMKRLRAISELDKLEDEASRKAAEEGLKNLPAATTETSA